MAISIPQERRPFVDFLLHVVFGGMMFLLLFLVAVGTAQVVKLLEKHDYVPEMIAQIMPYAETAFFILDLILFALFSLSEGLKLIRNLWR
jgi:hypothetical protein